MPGSILKTLSATRNNPPEWIKLIVKFARGELGDFVELGDILPLTPDFREIAQAITRDEGEVQSSALLRLTRAYAPVVGEQVCAAIGLKINDLLRGGTQRLTTPRYVIELGQEFDRCLFAGMAAVVELLKYVKTTARGEVTTPRLFCKMEAWKLEFYWYCYCPELPVFPPGNLVIAAGEPPMVGPGQRTDV